jgi:hypothetical protein
LSQIIDFIVTTADLHFWSALDTFGCFCAALVNFSFLVIFGHIWSFLGGFGRFGHFGRFWGFSTSLFLQLYKIDFLQ